MESSLEKEPPFFLFFFFLRTKNLSVKNLLAIKNNDRIFEMLLDDCHFFRVMHLNFSPSIHDFCYIFIDNSVPTHPSEVILGLGYIDYRIHIPQKLIEGNLDCNDAHQGRSSQGSTTQREDEQEKRIIVTTTVPDPKVRVLPKASDDRFLTPWSSSNLMLPEIKS